jgi:hypothetical protein
MWNGHGAPATIQFFLATKRPARTGTSVSSKVLTIDCEMYDQMWTWPVFVSGPIVLLLYELPIPLYNVVRIHGSVG